MKFKEELNDHGIMEDDAVVPFLEKNKEEEGWIKRMKLIFALLCLLGMVVTWIAMAELLQALQSSAKTKFNKPFFICYSIHGPGYTIFLLIWFIWWLFKGRFEKRKTYVVSIQNSEELEPNTTKRLAKVSLILVPIMFICALTWMMSLPLTSVEVNTGIYNSASLFVYAFSIPILHEKLSVLKVISVLFSLAGVCLLSFYSVGGGNTFAGIITVVVSTILYALYEVLYKRVVTGNRPSSPSNALFFLGMAGFWGALIFWPLFFVFHYTGYEKFELPDVNDLGELFMNLALDCSYNFLLLLGIMLTSPLFISVGTLLTVPASILADKIVHNTMLPKLAWPGIGLIIIGFLGLNLAEVLEWRREKKKGGHQ